MVVRTWNLFHGNTSPRSRRSYLREMVELITAGRSGNLGLPPAENGAELMEPTIPGAKE